MGFWGFCFIYYSSVLAHRLPFNFCLFGSSISIANAVNVSCSISRASYGLGLPLICKSCERAKLKQEAGEILKRLTGRHADCAKQSSKVFSPGAFIKHHVEIEKEATTFVIGFFSFQRSRNQDESALIDAGMLREGKSKVVSFSNHT